VRLLVYILKFEFMTVTVTVLKESSRELSFEITSSASLPSNGEIS
jgi:hypothetical protein